MQKPKVAIIGHGNVGSALERGLKRAGYEVPEAVVLAVPFGQIDATVQELGGAADGKPVIDVTNALGPNGELANRSTPSSRSTWTAAA